MKKIVSYGTWSPSTISGNIDMHRRMNLMEYVHIFMDQIESATKSETMLVANPYF